VDYSYYEIFDIISELGGLLSTLGTVLGPLAIVSLILFMEKLVSYILDSYKKKYVDIKMNEALVEASLIV
jgi:hypothetical protein